MAPGHISMKFTEVEVSAKFLKKEFGILSAHNFWVVTGKFVEQLYHQSKRDQIMIF